MKAFEILQFKANNSDTVFTKERSGEYINARGETKSLEDFLCSGNYKIASIRTKEHNRMVRENWNRIFTLGDVIPDLQPQILNNIKFKNGAPVILTTIGNEINIFETVIQNRNGNINADVVDFEQLQQRILNETPSIRLEKTLRNRKNQTWQEFIIAFFTEWNNPLRENKKNTVYVDRNDAVQTASGKRRSLGDVYRIVQYYYPNLTLKEFAKFMFVDLLQHGIRSNYCNQVRKRVWFSFGQNQHMDIGVTDEYGNLIQKYLRSFN